MLHIFLSQCLLPPRCIRERRNTETVLRAKISELYLEACPCHLSPVQPTILVEYLIEKRAVILNKFNTVIIMFNVPNVYILHTGIYQTVLGQFLPFCSSYCVIVRVRVVLKRTVVGN